ncbi:MAG: hypothetical protein KDI88_00435 [Gammaproteobacteria bacterium]|nr:hypothetical protein [Gammaproteobacteria bacterium]
MLHKPSLTTRIIVGKVIGLLFGLAGFVLLPYLWPGSELMLRWGVLFWYTMLGAIIGVFGVYDWHPVLRLPLPWWVRAPLIGGWMNFVLTLFTYDTLQAFLQHVSGVDGPLQSPFWFVLEGVLVGLVIGFFATRIGGEGAATVEPR